MINKINRNNKNINKRKSNGGFTLVELLATLAILSIVSVIVMYTATNVINSVKEKSYKVTINNIQKESGTYVLENDKDIFWLSDGGNSLYQCIIVQNLIDMGYFDNNILDSKISKDRKVMANDYVYIEKDKDTKTITKQVLLYDDSSEFRELCGDYVESNGNIIIDVPSGWAQNKDILITYKLNSSIGDSNNYNYVYKYEALNDSNCDYAEEKNSFTTLRTVSKKITVYDEGTVYAKIQKNNGEVLVPTSVEISGIDNYEPIITENISNQTVRGSVVIPIKISDSESGVDDSSISLSDFKVSIGGNVLDESKLKLEKINYDEEGEEINYYNYNLTINDRYYVGEVKIEIEGNQILDKVGNENKKTIISTGVIFDNKYKISYDSNGGSVCSGSKIVTYNNNIGDLCTPTRIGYIFIGWFDLEYKNAPLNYYADTYSDLKNTFSYNANNLWNHYLTYGKNEGRRISQYISTDTFKSENDITIYAGWKANTYTIKYNANGGSGSMSNTVCTYDQDCSLTSNTFKRTGYTYSNWNTKSNGTGTSYTNGQKVKNLTSNDNATVNLYTEWNANTYTIKYNYNGGKKGTNAPTSGTYDKVLTINVPTKTVTITGNINGTGATIGSATSKAQTFAGWTYSNGDTSTAEYGSSNKWTDANFKVNNSQYFKNLRSTSGTVTLTANWTPVAVTLPTISKIGYSCNWNTKADGSGDSYASGASYTPTTNSSSSITVYARCTPYKVNIKYNVNGGTISSQTTTTGGTVYNWSVNSSGTIKRNGNIFIQKVNHGDSFDLANYNNGNYINITKSRYIASADAEWICMSGCSTTNKIFAHNVKYSSSDFCDTSNGDCTIEVKVNWKLTTLWLYNSGNEYKETTGGWGIAHASYYPLDNWFVDPVINFGSSYVYIDATNTSGVNKYGAAMTKNKIDVTDYSKLYVKITERTYTGKSGNNIYATLGLYTEFTAHSDFRPYVTDGVILSPGVYSLDISNAKGFYYVGIATGCDNTQSQIPTSKTKFIEVYLEP